jgi:hypothetical protein
MHSRNACCSPFKPTIYDSLKAKEMSVIAFLSKAPTRILHRPTFAKKINDYLSKIELNYEQQNLLKRTSNEADLPLHKSL